MLKKALYLLFTFSYLTALCMEPVSLQLKKEPYTTKNSVVPKLLELAAARIVTLIGEGHPFEHIEDIKTILDVKGITQLPLEPDALQRIIHRNGVLAKLFEPLPYATVGINCGSEVHIYPARAPEFMSEQFIKDFYSKDSEYAIRFYDIASQTQYEVDELISRKPEEIDRYGKLPIANNDSVVISSFRESTLFIWNKKTKELRQCRFGSRASHGFHDITFSTDYSFLAIEFVNSNCRSGKIVFLHMHDWSEFKKELLVADFAPLKLTFSANNTYMMIEGLVREIDSTKLCRDIRVYDFATNTLLLDHPADTGVFSHNGTYCALRDNNKVYIYQTATMQLAQTIALPYDDIIDFEFCFSRDETAIFLVGCSGRNHTIYAWSIKDGTMIYKFSSDFNHKIRFSNHFKNEMPNPTTPGKYPNGFEFLDSITTCHLKDHLYEQFVKKELLKTNTYLWIKDGTTVLQYLDTGERVGITDIEKLLISPHETYALVRKVNESQSRLYILNLFNHVKPTFCEFLALILLEYQSKNNLLPYTPSAKEIIKSSKNLWLKNFSQWRFFEKRACCICTKELPHNELILPCGHAQIHQECLAEWHKANTGCPVCINVTVD